MLTRTTLPSDAQAEKAAVEKAAAKRRKQAKSFWFKQLHTWHWISSAISLIGLLLFAFTGITLNHAGDIDSAPKVVERGAQLPPALLRQVAPDGKPDSKAPLPAPIADWVQGATGQRADGAIAEWSAAEIYVPLPRPGGDGWVSIDRSSGKIASEVTDRGWISWLNDMHKGRNAGTAWKWFIDIFGVACFLFAFTGLFLLWLHSARRPSTWPLVALGLIIPAILAIFFIH